MLLLILSIVGVAICRTIPLFGGARVKVPLIRPSSSLPNNAGLLCSYIGLLVLKVSVMLCVRVSGVTVTFSLCVSRSKLSNRVLFLVTVCVLPLMCVSDSNRPVKRARSLAFRVVALRASC